MKRLRRRLKVESKAEIQAREERLLKRRRSLSVKGKFSGNYGAVSEEIRKIQFPKEGDLQERVTLDHLKKQHGLEGISKIAELAAERSKYPMFSIQYIQLSMKIRELEKYRNRVKFKT